MSLAFIPIMSDLHTSSPPKADEPLGKQFSQLISGVQQYLMQERDLFGNIIYPSAEQGMQPRSLKEKTVSDYPAEPWANTSSLSELNSMICECQKCSLGATRTKFVFGVGNAKAEIVLIGEAPGADEDAKGEPFVGRAGQLLNKILEAIHFKREEVYICNILKCRPPEQPRPASRGSPAMRAVFVEAARDHQAKNHFMPGAHFCPGIAENSRFAYQACAKTFTTTAAFRCS